MNQTARKKVYLLVGALCFGVCTNPVQSLGSETKFAFDPYVGYALGGGVAQFNSSAGTSTNMGSFSGFGFGSDLRFHFSDYFFIGFDAHYFPNLGFTPAGGASANSSTNRSLLRLGPTIGLGLKSILLYAGYHLIDSFNPGASYNGVDYTGTLNGTSFKLGLGYQPMEYLALHLDYYWGSYGSLTSNNSTSTLSTGNTVSQSVFLLSAHIPLYFTPMSSGDAASSDRREHRESGEASDDGRTIRLSGTVEEKLVKLKNMRRAGLITAEEYERKMSEIMRGF